MNIKTLCKHIMETLKVSGLNYEVIWNIQEEKMVWKKEKQELFFCKSDVAHFAAEQATHNRYLTYIIENLTKIETSTSELLHIVSTLEQYKKEIVPFEYSNRFPKMTVYSSVKKKILVNPIKLFDYVETIRDKTHLTPREVYIFVFLHEYGHFIEERQSNLASHAKVFLNNAQNEFEEELVVLGKINGFIYDLEKKAWDNGTVFLPLFSCSKEAYEEFSLLPLATYKNLSSRYVREKLRYGFCL